MALFNKDSPCPSGAGAAAGALESGCIMLNSAPRSRSLLAGDCEQDLLFCSGSLLGSTSMPSSSASPASTGRSSPLLITIAKGIQGKCSAVSFSEGKAVLPLARASAAEPFATASGPSCLILLNFSQRQAAAQPGFSPRLFTFSRKL